MNNRMNFFDFVKAFQVGALKLHNLKERDCTLANLFCTWLSLYKLCNLARFYIVCTRCFQVFKNKIQFFGSRFFVLFVYTDSTSVFCNDVTIPFLLNQAIVFCKCFYKKHQRLLVKSFEWLLKLFGVINRIFYNYFLYNWIWKKFLNGAVWKFVIF